MLPIRIKACSESDLRMLGNLARNIQRVLPVTQADIDAAAALGKGWVVWKVIEVNDPIDNLRGGTQLVIKQNSITPGQNVRRVLIVSGPGGQVVVIGPDESPLLLPDAIADTLSYVKAFGGTEQRNLPDGYIERQFIYMMAGSYLKVEDLLISAGYRVEFEFQTLTLASPLRNFIGGRANGVSAGGGFRLSKLASGGSTLNRVVLYGFESGTEYYDPTTQFQSNTRYKYTYNNGVCTLETGGSVVSTRTFTVTDTTSTKWGINSYVSGNDYWQTDTGDIYVYSVKVWNDQGELVMDLVPAVQRGTVPVVGFYDTVTGGFRTASDGTFAAGGEAVPTPDKPMDIVSNNGALKARHASGLPLGYTLLEYISANNGPYIETDIKIASTDIVETEFANNSSTGYGALYGIYDTGQSSAFYANQTYYGYDATNNKVDTGVAVDTDWHTVVHNFVAGTLTLDGNTVSFTPFSFTNTVNNAIFARYYNGSYGYFFRGKIRKHKVTRGNTVLCYMVPVRNDSTSELGLYDLINDRFWTNSGSGSFSAGDPVSDPVEIYTGGPIETIAIKDDQSATVSTATCENLLSISDNTDKQEIIGGVVTRKVGIKVFDGTENWSRATNQDGSANYVFYTQIDNKKVGNNQPMLCTHYDYIGSASYVTLTTGKFLSNSANTSVYFDGGSITTVTNWKKWLVDQAAAGTPVIVIYPLADSTTETVAGQPMETAAGDNTVEITQAGMNGLELEAEYIKAE